ncbi:MAG: ABC transporter ATP-binding protein [Pseudomonadota bacterium]
MLALEIKDLKKTYKTGFEALKGIDLSVEHGDFFALLGPNGAGKSTTIGIVTTLVNKTSGSVKIYGHDLDVEPKKAKALLGIVPQEVNVSVFSKVYDVVYNQAGFYGVDSQTARQQTEKLLKAMDLWEKRGVTLRQLSGGMKRRLMIARALVHQPKFLILDEPTAGVDIELRRSMWEFLQEVNRQGTTIILTTHYLEEAEQLCNKIAIIDQGKIIENTDKKTLLSQLNVETMLLDLQQPLSTLPDLSPYKAKLIEATVIEVEILKEQNINPLFEKLSQHHIQITSLRNKTNRLEELFIRLVNKTG